MLTGLWAVLALVSAGAGLAAVLSVQSSVGQTAVRPLSQEDVERAVATGSSGGSDIALDAVDGLASPVTKPSDSLTPEESGNDDGGDLAVAQTDRSQEPRVSTDASSSRTTGTSSDSAEPSHDSSTTSHPTSDESTTTESDASQSQSESESSGKGSGRSGSNGSNGSNSSNSGSSSQGSAPSPRSGAATPTAEPQD